MAQIPNQKLIKAIQKQTKKEIRNKKISQFFKGKKFILPGGGSSGVIPEETWKGIKP